MLKKPPTHAHKPSQQTPRTPKTAPPRPQIKHVAPPPAFRPQPVPKVLQTKTANTVNHSPRKPTAPPVYRPENRKLVQPKVLSKPQIQLATNSSFVARQLTSGRPPVGPKQTPRQTALPVSPRRQAATIQCVPDLKPRTHVQVTDEGPTWYGQIVGARDNGASYEVRVGGTDTHRVVPEASVSLHPIRARPFYVGMGQFVRSYGLMRTDKLYNCIAVVAFHEESGYAAFTHYNTIGAFENRPTGEENDEGESINRYELDLPGLNQLKAKLLQTLQRNSAAGVDFYVALGDYWRETAKSTDTERRMKRELIDGLKQVFTPVSLITGGSLTAKWDPSPPFPALL